MIVEGGGDTPTFQSVMVEGVGRSWVSSSRGMLGTVRWTLDYEGEQLPDPMILMVRGTGWMEVETATEVGLDRAVRS